VVKAIRATPGPAGAEVLVGGRPATDLDQINSLVDRLPWMGIYVAVATFLLLFLAFGSVVLPAKAIIMNIISIGASFGVVVWIFQDGHLSNWLGFTPTGYLEPTNLILMLAILFGLSTDYEVFLLSRMTEARAARADPPEAIRYGIAHTGGVITSAAAILIVVTGAFGFSDLVLMKYIAYGMIAALIIDATVIRMLLTPAVLKLIWR
jgi:RND superfamily putative drug exporter